MTLRDHATKAPKARKTAPSAPRHRPADPTAVALAAHHGLPAPVAELHFHAARRWRFDYAWPEHRIALEVEGGVWSRGRHTTPAGFLADMEKYNAAAVLGWRVLRCAPGARVGLDLSDGFRLVAEALRFGS